MRRMVTLFLLNLAALAIFWIAGFALIRVAGRLFDGWPAPIVAQLASCVFGVAVALRLRARLMAYFLAAMAAVMTAELLIQVGYGVHAIQGAPRHFAVMAAALLGITFGAWMARHLGRTGRGEGAEAAA